MPYRLILKPEAEKDFDDAIAWYETQQKGLGEGFISKLDNLFFIIVRNPKLFQVFHRQYRRAFLTRFPYAVFYLVDEMNKQVTIYAILHTHRNPDVWKQRII